MEISNYSDTIRAELTVFLEKGWKGFKIKKINFEKISIFKEPKIKKKVDKRS